LTIAYAYGSRASRHVWARGAKRVSERRSNPLAIGEGGRCPSRVKLGRAGDVRCTTALPPKADVHLRSCYVAFVPQTDIRWVGWREAYILPPAEAGLLGRMKRGSSQIMTPLASAEAELQSDRAALLRLRSDRGCGRVGCEQFCSDSGRTKA
jgi:hypothetical protein